MRLKSLELQGFKSFPDKTTLTFGDGITAIVGPNGSGKSNISDAVRWVLGEQSTKTLRGSKMEDVIFGGTLKRNAVGYAEVSLTIDNSDGVLATEYSEVMVTRRYYRSGESEFYINRRAVRLRDIHELFMDTGLGRDGYSIIGQGRIDEILSLKSEDRREIFEEAAGISKFRHRKEEAERKLNATEENLVRIRDIISELEVQVEPLAKQAEDARKYLLIHDELRGLEIDLWMHQLDKSRESLHKLQNDFQIATSQFNRGQKDVEMLYAEVDGLSGKMREKDAEIENMRNARFKIESEKAQRASEITVLENNIENNRENITRIERELSDEATRAGTIDDQIEERSARIAELCKMTEQLNASIEICNNEIRAALESSADMGKRLSAIQEEKSAVENALNECKIKSMACMSSSDAKRARIEEIKASIADCEEKLSSAHEKKSALAKAKREAEETLTAANNVLAGVSLKKKKREEKLSFAREEYNKLDATLQAMEHKLQVLNDLERDMEGFSGAVKLIHRAGERGELVGVLGTVAKLVRVPEKYTTAIETILGAALQNVVVANESTAKAGIAYLKRANGGRATFLPLTTIRGGILREQGLDKCEGFVGIASELVSFDDKYKNIFESLLGRIVVSTDINTASELAKKFGFKFRIVTLDGQVINVGGSYTGGSVGKNTGILSRANEIDTLNKKIVSAREQMEEKLKEKNEAERELNSLVFEAEVHENNKREAEDILLRAETELSHSRELIEAGEESLDALTEETEREERAVTAYTEELEILRKSIAENEATVDTLASEIDALLESDDEIRNERDEKNAKLSDLREQLASALAEHTEAERARDNLCALRDGISGDNEQKRRIISEYLQRNEEIQTQIEQIKGNITEYQDKLSKIDLKIEEISNERLTIEALRNKKDKESKEKNDELLNMERERMRLEGKLESAENNERIIADKLWDTYEITISAAEEVRRTIESLSEVNSRISILKGERKKLGNVNLGAIEEYERVSERYGFLSEQRDDLERAKAEISEKIDGITKNMREIFAEQFKIINQSFSETFTEIFGGGKAELSLDDPDDILSCGIEIRVQPPGKSLRTITLLSGGERAFVAIALYFAIMKVRPTPFCVLDEIEAALDDVNVVRYANYLRKLTKTTQFIVITHRRGTMEEADVLYGVTMQDAGISKMLTISIAEVEHELNIKLK